MRHIVCEKTATMIVPMIKNQIMNPIAKIQFMLLSISMLHKGHLKLAWILRRGMPLLQLGQVLMIFDVVRSFHKDAILSGRPYHHSTAKAPSVKIKDLPPTSFTY